jgi:hypothetical protein
MADTDLESTVGEMRGFIARIVASGFELPANVIESAVEVYVEQADEDVLRPIAERLTLEAVAAHLIDQATWPEETDCDRLDDAMIELTRNGIVCRQNFSCCGNCGVAEIGEEMAAERRSGVDVRGFAFYHMQDTEAATEGHGVYLNYGALEPGEAAALGVAREIVETVERHGLETAWNGSWNTRIWIKLDWKRRLPQGP